MIPDERHLHFMCGCLLLLPQKEVWKNENKNDIIIRKLYIKENADEHYRVLFRNGQRSSSV